MPPIKVILLACGSFNPPTNMHLRMFEIARDHLHRLGNHVVIGGIMSPVHDAYGKSDLMSASHRLNMLKLSLQTSDWIKISDWECKQESWSRTSKILQHHQNHLNSIINQSNMDYNNVNEDELWIPENVRNTFHESIQVKLLCGGDLLESFGKPGLWADADIEAILEQHGLVVITREKTNPLEFIYNSDLLTKYMANIIIVTEWIRNEVSSTRIRKALRRSESVKYLLPDKVIEYIHRHKLYGCQTTKYLFPPVTQYPSHFLTPSPSDPTLDSPSPTQNQCFTICNNNILSIYQSNETVDNNSKAVSAKHPGQAVQIMTSHVGDKFVTANAKKLKEVCTKEASKTTSTCKKCDIYTYNKRYNLRSNHKVRNIDAQVHKFDEANIMKFIFMKQGIQIIKGVDDSNQM